MTILFSRYILFILLAGVAALEKDIEVPQSTCTEGSGDESCQKDAIPNESDKIDPFEAIKKYGVGQIAEGREAHNTVNRIKETLEYMKKWENKKGRCRNEHELCAFWAVIGECEKNSYMLNHCGPSCLSCATIPGDDIIGKPYIFNDKSLTELSEAEVLDAVKEYGEPQQIEGQDKAALLNLVVESVDYMRHLGDSLKQEIKDECKNKHELCAFWASIGECEANVAYMKVNCSPSCRSCQMIDFDHRCPPRDPDLEPGLKPYDLDKRFQQIVDNPDFKVTVHSRPDLDKGTDTSQPPWVITIDDFLTSDECDTLIKLGGKEGYERSKDVGPRKVDGSFEPYENEGRTSTNAWCSNDCAKDQVAVDVYERISKTVQIPTVNYEDFQILRYDVGQFYKQHHDYIGHQKDRSCGPRILTFYQYLSDVEEGGGTAFPKLGIEVKPKKGRVLLWPSVLSSDPLRKDYRMDHEALPVIKGLKYGANAWIHQYDYKTPQKINCA